MVPSEGGDVPEIDHESLYADWRARREGSGAEQFSDLCAAHPELAPKLRRLHGQVERVQDLMGDGATTLPTPQSGEEREHPFDSLIARLARHRPSETRYVERGELGRGGMGAVIEVYDVDLRRRLAKKVMLDERAHAAGTPASDPSMLGRFVEEAQVTAQLGHPGVVPVHELGLDEEGRIFFTMERVGGRTLKGVFKQARAGAEDWSVARAVGVLVRVCETLAYAHSKGVIHRDLKPSNVMVGEFGEVYVMDWGLAKLVSAAEAGAASESVKTDRDEASDRDPFAGLRTETGQAAGTPGYMAPEQARGEVSALDARTDVWALGAMLYELLCGARPYDELIRARAMPAMLRAMQAGDSTPLVELAPDAPPELVSIVEMAMQAQPDERYQDAEAMAADLRAWLEGRVVAAHERGAWAELRKWVGRNKGLAAALLVAFLALVGGASGMAVFERNGRIGVERERAVAEVNAGPTTMEGLWPRAETIWPATPEQAEALELWLRQAEDLARERPLFEEALGALRGQPSRFEGSELDPALRGSLEGLIDRLDELPGRHAWISRGLAMATTVEERTLTGGPAESRWASAINAIAAAPIYGGLELTPQRGLLPLREDPESGLWEFWHVLSGVAPEPDPETGRWKVEAAAGVVLVLIPAGKTLVGAPQVPEGDPLHDWYAGEYDYYYPDPSVREVELDAFFLSKYELTDAQWRRAYGEQASAPDDALAIHPRTEVSWETASEVTRRFDLELPTEAQWEAAARAGTRWRFYTGMDPQSLTGHVCLLPDSENPDSGQPDEAADLDDNGRVVPVFGHQWRGTHEPVGSFLPNPYGLHDIHGNVWEWCLDVYDVEVPPRPGDGLRDSERTWPYRAARGGGYASTFAWARVSYRFQLHRIDKDTDTGVRPARSID